MHQLIFNSSNEKAYQAGFEIGQFIADNLFLIIALILGLVVAIIMRKSIKAKP